ncbi:hypothetical protein BDV25DRAFT_170996 [Aspergillus avenaceus]|uniref:FAD-binding domain-containing protein n=1 Tax=Aspergillus avenaceus TaxID=36643 RepID=A0A5N6U8H9_ASPAV|nr:hypothetical protein BDV25DRAFT_170996 [Aspergillus avenaceus]
MAPAPFKVIIVGGSIAGLTLAHCLEQAGIAYTVLEKHNIAPQLGASLSISPNGGRILDQLGLYDCIEPMAVAIKHVRFAFDDGFAFIERYPSTLRPRYGYPLLFLERQQLLGVLCDKLRDKSAVFAHKPVVSVRHTGEGVRVTTEDGSTYDGDIVVGADGVHSIVRSEMHNAASKLPSGPISKRKHDQMTSQFSCTFGISTDVKGATAGEVLWTSHDGHEVIAFPSHDGKVFWFLMVKLNTSHQHPNVPRYNHNNAIETCQAHVHLAVGNGLTFGDLWTRRWLFGMTALEEGVAQTWHFGRMVCIGDSIHKVTLEIGQGANLAIEDAAALANTIRELVKGNETPTPDELNSALKKFNDFRLPRVTSVCKFGSSVTRLTTGDHPVRALFARFALQYITKLCPVAGRRIFALADKIDYLPTPMRAGPEFAEALRPTRWLSPTLASAVVVSVLFFVFILAPSPRK